MKPIAFLLQLGGLFLATVSAEQSGESGSFDYSSVFSAARNEGLRYDDVPGFTRSRYAADHALICPESRVWQPYPTSWKNTLTAHLITPAVGATFSMYLADFKAGGLSSAAPAGVERFAFVLDGSLNVTDQRGRVQAELHADSYAFFPAGSDLRLGSERGGGVVVIERYAVNQGKTQFLHGETAKQPVLAVPGEVFALRKLLPATSEYGFNIHIMDFEPGEYLNVKELHYNQHGLLLLQGKGIYRLADNWYSVQAGDAIWMPPFAIQWYAALGKETSRYLLFKDTFPDPVQHGQGLIGHQSK